MTVPCPVPTNGHSAPTTKYDERPQARAVLTDPSLKGALPADFLYGCATASYQVEGGYDADGKGLNVWDVCLKDRENGETACDSYRLWRKDVALLQKYGCNSYRFSISWARLIPLGGKDDPINQAGIDYYNGLIDYLIERGIKPLATIFHWDIPQALQDRYGGFLSDKIIPDFVAFARLCFKSFGDRVKDWCSFNEPMIFAMQSSSSYLGEGWVHRRDHAILARTTLLSHARSVEAYRKEFADQKGRIGLVLNCDWLEGVDDSPAAVEAAQWVLDWVMGMYAGPIYQGTVPPSVLAYLGEYAHILDFSPEERAVLHGSSDFFGWNHYGTQLTSGKRVETSVPRLVSFGSVERVFERDGIPIGVKGEAGHPYDVPWGFRKLIRYISQNYCVPNDIPIIITECGFTPEGEAQMSWDERINDVTRQDYYAGYLKEMIEAVRDDKIRVEGFMAWSLMDNIEWLYGYDKRFGITCVDEQLVRHPKDSSKLLRAIFEHAMKS